ncbi:hypothetical protein V6N13_145882 [Hibiscus sabdariffa]|uniref:Uncharacterized protein n=1 Tax=Hibiscus sabdariffa TaxID=183260 RepID=A0ABR2TR50_9ROSI
MELREDYPPANEAISEPQTPRKRKNSSKMMKNKQRFSDEQIRLMESIFESETRLDRREEKVAGGERVDNKSPYVFKTGERDGEAELIRLICLIIRVVVSLDLREQLANAFCAITVEKESLD